MQHPALIGIVCVRLLNEHIERHIFGEEKPGDFSPMPDRVRMSVSATSRIEAASNFGCA
ncbi:MAG TPA: hypothetical protein VGM43_28025 [Bryobacteraceae bacterium]